MPARKPEQEKEVLDWIQAVLGEPLPDGEFEEVCKYYLFNIRFVSKIKIKMIKYSTHFNIFS